MTPDRAGAGKAAGDGVMLRLEGITVNFGGLRALDAVWIHARAGEVLGIIGPNGAGKTTLFDVTSGVRAPDGGRVWLAGVDVTAASVSQRARLGLRRTFQRVQTFGWLSVEDNVLTALEWRGGGGGFLGDVVGWRGRRRRERKRRQVVAAALDRCGLTAVKDELAGSLPIGTARMVELARAMVDRPAVLLLDEPASGLDGIEAARLGEQIQRLAQEDRCAVLLVEHDAAFLMAQSDRVVVLDQGAVLTEGTPEAIQNDEAVRDAYLGPAMPRELTPTRPDT